MKRFLLSSLILILLLAAVDFGVGCFFRALDNHLLSYPIDYQTAYHKIMCQIDDDIVIIGNSRARHQYIPTQIADSLGMSTINAAKDGSRFLIQATLIQGLLKRYTPIVILWETDPNSLTHIVLDDELNRMSDLNPYYDTDSLSRQMILLKNPEERFKMLSQCYRNNGRILGLLRVLFQGHFEDTNRGYVPVSSHGYQYPTIKIQNYPSESYLDREELFTNTLAQAQKQGCTIVITTTPEYLTTNIQKTIQYERFTNICDSLHVPIIDFHDHPDFLSDSSYFKGNTHLNERGTQHYMQLFIPKLKSVLFDTSYTTFL